MSFPLNISFKDQEFERVNTAAKLEGKAIRDFAKDATLEKAEELIKAGKSA
jgi:uncharacterized protein (DUF1778 family)